ncbi:MAG: class I SAM-dependent methyltransferase [Rubrivivax sp.]|nr:class I SAM-dependent methyltransferase [Rubrivivax sp.]
MDAALQAADLNRRREVWARYWAGGALHACATSYGAEYGGAIAEFWRDVFGGLQPGQRVLDIATGNGALPRLLFACRSDVECDAVDLSPVAPTWVDQLPPAARQRLRFHDNTAAEGLSFADGRFDLVVSQYGLEYCQLGDAAAQVRRVLGSRGRVAMVIHHVDSRPVELARDELAHVGWLRLPDGLVDAAAQLLEPMARAATPAGRDALAGDARANAAREHFNRLQRELSQRLVGATCPDVLHEVRHALAQVLATAQRHGEAAARDRLARLCRHLDDSRVRLEELVACALDATGVDALVERLAPPGATVTVEELREGPWLMGWALRVAS